MTGVVKPLGAALVAVASAGLIAGCGLSASTTDAVVTPVTTADSATSSTPSVSILADAEARLTALRSEAASLSVQQSTVAARIAELKASDSCQEATKSCDKKLAILVGEQKRLESRATQFPTALSVVETRISQLRTRSV